MAVTDPTADALTKIRNASRAQHATVEVNASHFIERVLEVLKREGVILSYKAVGDAPSNKCIRVYLKYVGKHAALQQLVRVSKPGVRVYRKADKLPRVRRGLGFAVVSTSQGLLSDKEAYRKKVGGEVICYVW